MGAMSRLLYIDPFGGAAGDMLLGALLDAGVDRGRLDAVLAGLGLPGWRLEVSRDRQQGFGGTRVTVHVEQPGHPARRLADVEGLLRGAALPGRVRERALDAFRRLFQAEAEVHGVDVDETHLHELSAVDAVVDIVGVCAAVELLDVERIECAPVPVGSGTVQTAHGLLPVPPPAVARLLMGVPLAGHAADGEMTTPTGATLLVTLADGFGPVPQGRLAAVGVGLGTREFRGMPNVLRVMLLEREARPSGRPMVVLETTVDDVTGETLGALLERVREAGALDAWCLAGTGRKGRPVMELRAVIEPAAVPAVCAAVFAEGATLGVRLVECTRPELERHAIEVPTPYGAIPVKVGVFQGRVVSAKPEHDAIRSAARVAGVTDATVADAARAAAPRVGAAWVG
jgi:pyridinium-3,5-bisthiocarboxylic acid mononucleotide nickel chelatase